LALTNNQQHVLTPPSPKPSPGRYVPVALQSLQILYTFVLRAEIRPMPKHVVFHNIEYLGYYGV
jgi:hypothetical protein